MTAALLLLGGWAIHAGGGLAAGAPSFASTSRFVEFAEEAAVATRHRPASGAAFEAGLSRALSPRLAIALVVARDTRDAPGTFTAALPHPLYLGRPRMVEGTAPAGRRETAIHFGLAWSHPVGGVVVRVTAGPSYLLADADLVEAVSHAHEYPYDEARVTGVRTSSVKGDALGGHVAAAFERRLSARLAIGGEARWSRAKVRLASGTGDTARRADVTAGGVSAALGLRLYF